MKTKMLLYFRLLVAVALSLATPACQWEEPLSPEAQRFKDAVRGQLAMLEPGVAKGLAADDEAAVDEALMAYFGQTPWLEEPCSYSAHVVNGQHLYVAGRWHAPGSQSAASVKKEWVRYSNFKSIFDELESGRIKPVRLYDQDGPFVVICAPLRRDDKFIGVIGLILPDDCLPGRFDLTPDQVLAIDYN